MKKIFLSAFLLIISVPMLAQLNAQLHYDFGETFYDGDKLSNRPHFAATVENFKLLHRLNNDFKLSLGTELELSKNLVWPAEGINNKFYAIPTLAIKWQF